MPVAANPAWAELIQLVPIISLALPFIIHGEVDLGRAGPGFLLGGVLTIIVWALLLSRRLLLNPILVGTGVWLIVGAVAFNVPLAAIADWYKSTQGFGLFVAALVSGLAFTFASRFGYVAVRNADPSWIRRTSFLLLALNAVTVAWAWVFRHDIRLGGGLPFIVLNAARRVLGARAPELTAQTDTVS